MSALDRWITAKPFARNEGAATSATSATSQVNPQKSAAPDVAGRLLHSATSTRNGTATKVNVAACSSEVATSKPAEIRHSLPHVADVADVARGRFPSADPFDPPPAGHSPDTPSTDDALTWRRAYFAECDRIMIRDGIVLAQAQPKAFERLLHDWHLARRNIRCVRHA
jgi:hypothetical protein